MRLVSAEQMQEIDRRAQQEYGIPDLVLMENAGIKLFAALHDFLDEPSQILFVAGTGNNGGDALVMARQCLVEGTHEPSVLLVGPNRSEACEVQARICRALDIPIVEWSSADGVFGDTARLLLESSHVVVDGLFGTGLKEGMREPYDQLAAELNRSSATVFAVDVPSGLGDSFKGDFAAVKADVTLTVEFPKAALFLPASRPLAGRIQVVPIGFPPDLEDGESSAARLLTSGDLAALLPSIPPTSYKHARGTVGVFAGAIGTSGAALLAGEAAAVSGSGLVLCAVDEDLYPVVAGGAASVMVEPIDQTELGLERFASLLIGSGWSTRSGRGELLGRLLAAGIGGVLDADAINLIADSAQLREKDFGNRFVLTPHPGEFARLAAALSIAFDADDPRPALRAVSARLNVTVAYKSHVVWIVEPGGRETVVDGMNPAMGTGGTGDVFAGILASLIGSGLGAGAAARAGALLFQVAGRHARSDIGVFTAEQLFPYIAELAGQRLLGEEG